MPSSVEIVCVDPKIIRKVWPNVSGLIRSAIEQTGLCQFSDVETAVLRGDQLLWVAISDRIEAAATTHLIKTSGKPVLVVTACAGSHRERWLPLRHRVENYAKAEGCSCIRLYGRKGWERVLKDYRVEHVIMEKAL